MCEKGKNWEPQPAVWKLAPERGKLSRRAQMKAQLLELLATMYPQQAGRQTAGKSGGYRTLVATNKGNRWVFVYGFPKNERANIDKDEAQALKKLATHLLSLTAQAVTRATEAGELIEVDCDAEDQVPHPGRRA